MRNKKTKAAAAIILAFLACLFFILGYMLLGYIIIQALFIFYLSLLPPRKDTPPQ